jgi:hypothetical protein
MKSIVEQVQDEIRFCKSTYNSCIRIKDCFDISTGKNLFVIKSDYLNDCSVYITIFKIELNML